jgi:hypothetical protein
MRPLWEKSRAAPTHSLRGLGFVNVDQSVHRLEGARSLCAGLCRFSPSASAGVWAAARTGCNVYSDNTATRSTHFGRDRLAQPLSHRPHRRRCAGEALVDELPGLRVRRVGAVIVGWTVGSSLPQASMLWWVQQTACTVATLPASIMSSDASTHVVTGARSGCML